MSESPNQQICEQSWASYLRRLSKPITSFVKIGMMVIVLIASVWRKLNEIIHGQSCCYCLFGWIWRTRFGYPCVFNFKLQMYPIIGLSPEDPEWNEGSECWWMSSTPLTSWEKVHLHHLPRENSLLALISLAFFPALLNALTPLCDHYWLHPKYHRLPPSLLFPKAWNCFFSYCFPTSSKSRLLARPQEGCPCQTGGGGGGQWEGAVAFPFVSHTLLP